MGSHARDREQVSPGKAFTHKSNTTGLLLIFLWRSKLDIMSSSKKKYNKGDDKTEEIDEGVRQRDPSLTKN